MAYSYIQSSQVSYASSQPSMSVPAITVASLDTLLLCIYFSTWSAYAGSGVGFAISDGGIGNTYVFRGYGSIPSALTVSTWNPGGGSSANAVGAGLSAVFSGVTGNYTIIFSDSETRLATCTNGSATVTWSPALTGTPTTALTILGAGSNGGLALFDVLSANAGSTALTISNTVGSGLSAAYLAEYSGLSAFLGAAGNYATGFGSVNANAYSSNGANGAPSGPINVSAQPAMLWGMGLDFQQSGNLPNAPGTTLAFAGRGNVWATLNGGTNASGTPEDVRITATGNYSATWGTVSGNIYDAFLGVAGAYQEIGPVISPSYPLESAEYF
jgi:hypothetical protein